MKKIFSNITEYLKALLEVLVYIGKFQRSHSDCAGTVFVHMNEDVNEWRPVSEEYAYWLQHRELFDGVGKIIVKEFTSEDWDGERHYLRVNITLRKPHSVLFMDREGRPLIPDPEASLRTLEEAFAYFDAEDREDAPAEFPSSQDSRQAEYKALLYKDGSREIFSLDSWSDDTGCSYFAWRALPAGILGTDALAPVTTITLMVVTTWPTWLGKDEEVSCYEDTEGYATYLAGVFIGAAEPLWQGVKLLPGRDRYARCEARTITPGELPESQWLYIGH